MQKDRPLWTVAVQCERVSLSFFVISILFLSLLAIAYLSLRLPCLHNIFTWHSPLYFSESASPWHSISCSFNPTSPSPSTYSIDILAFRNLYTDVRTTFLHPLLLVPSSSDVLVTSSLCFRSRLELNFPRFLHYTSLSSPSPSFLPSLSPTSSSLFFLIFCLYITSFFLLVVDFRAYWEPWCRVAWRK